MLQFFVLPVFAQPRRNLRIVGAMVRQIAGVQVGAGFDERGADEQVEQVFARRDALTLNGAEVQRFNPPVRLAACGNRFRLSV